MGTGGRIGAVERGGAGCMIESVVALGDYAISPPCRKGSSWRDLLLALLGIAMLFSAC